MRRILLGLMAGSIVLASMQERAIATEYSIHSILVKIKQNFSGIVLLPSADVVESNKFRPNVTLYAYIQASSEDLYNVSFSNQTGTGHSSNAAFRFGIRARLNPEFDRRSDYKPEYLDIKLIDGSPALVTSWCGASCWSTVQWKLNNIVYETVVKKKESTIAIEIANSAVKAGDRLCLPTKSHSSP